ncbi:YjbA family protein [Mangrovibacillus cuniculi]|uniref:DUF3603 family protein n=1 Tax=Mangrovibacillus cuniculi TaxID=2593652 RepID=A0A7S8HF55_9BACI|nr:YjbA family protein [Mangrovibacillus cuniculi]QPC46070.1 DUF3603 family protein [Mangrovibacillus cuniculi]
MQYLHDVWVNWFEGEENGYNVCHFHEWKREDVIELLDQVPLLYISRDLFEYIENDLSELPALLLEEIYQKSYLRKNHERTTVDYACVLTDGNRIIAIDTIGYQIPIRKSRIIPRHEQLVYEMIQQEEPRRFEIPRNAYKKEHHILSPSPIEMRGLTRKERQLKQLLYMALDHLYTSKNVSELRYWFTEWEPDQYRNIQHLSFEELWTPFYSAIKSGWSKEHVLLCERMIKGQPFFERLWEVETQSVNEKPPLWH